METDRRRVAALIGAAVLATAAVGCESAEPENSFTTPATPSVTSAPAAEAPPADAGALDAARAFAVAAREWAPETYVAQWRRQVAGSAGRLRRTLRAAEPSREELARLAADGARVDVEVVGVQPDPSASPPRARVFVSLDESTTVGGGATTIRTISRVDLVRRGERWLVVAFEPAA